MIRKIHLSKQGAYDADGTDLDDLKALNFIFGSNGSGKTTISRVVESVSKYPDCSIKWASENPLETRVYNRDFVQKHFDAESSIKGIYTFGENIDVVEKVNTLKAEADDIDKKLQRFQKTLNGDGSTGGKQKEHRDLEDRIKEVIWQAKMAFKDLDQAFSGLNKNKQKFWERYRVEAEENDSDINDIRALREDAAVVFSSALKEITRLPKQDSVGVIALESEEILTKKILGKEDVDISALIKELGNSDWVQEGRQYFEKLDSQCPFCQQKTDAVFRKNLEDYFDEGYVADLVAIDNLFQSYDSKMKALLAAYCAPDVIESPFLDREAFEKDLATLRLALEANIASIKRKREEPSASMILKDTRPLFGAMDTHIETANTNIKHNNDTLRNLDERKSELSSQVWRRLLEDTKLSYDNYNKESGKLDKAIASLNAQIERQSEDFDVKQNEIEEIEKQITSIKPTIEEINKLLKSFGFVNFHLVESADEGFDEVKRPCGDDAKDTLSEGEKSFITFLYFYHHIKGSFSASGATTNRIVVFDDPVSSLDADILFIVCNLIKGIVNEMRAGDCPIKQIFVLTHNIYFHKEVTFDKDRGGTGARSDETFWIIRKSSNRSQLFRSPDNPIKSSYELLWREVRQQPPSDTAIQNVMRRIIEHYFKFFGGVAPDEIIEKFEGKEKIICGSLFSWINDGSHFANDDLFISCDPGQTERYLEVFRRIFEVSDHHGHYKMMMGDDYVEKPIVAAEQTENFDILAEQFHHETMHGDAVNT